MSATINYTLSYGVYPITVSISPEVAPSQLQTVPGTYSFTNVPYGSYILIFTDSGGCTVNLPVEVMPPIPSPSPSPSTSPATLARIQYGLLYNWYTVNDSREIASEGWHVPSDEELLTLRNYLDPVNNDKNTNLAGEAMKEIGITTWVSPNIATNSSNLSFSGAGYRYYHDGIFLGLNYASEIWSSTEISDTMASSGMLTNNGSNFNFDEFSSSDKKNGFSIRLIKDNSSNTGIYTGNDGKVYPTVKVGNQVWMAANLAETLYRYDQINGALYNWYAATKTKRVSIYGALYNWYAANDARIAPSGWHVPTKTEIETLQTTIGNDTTSLKDTGTTYWTSPNTYATNTTGFAWRGGGYRGDRYEGSLGYFAIKAWGLIWASDEYSSTKGWHGKTFADYYLGTPILEIGSSQKFTGYGIRLVKNDSVNTGSVIDYDGNVYDTVKIGNQVWMASGLIVTHFNDGTSISNVTSASVWDTATTPAMCDYANTVSNSYTVLPALAPTGWHLPSKAEFDTLFTSAGGALLMAGKKLKEVGTEHWGPSNTGTDDYGFAAIGGGYRIDSGQFVGINYSGIYWINSILNCLVEFNPDINSVNIGGELIPNWAFAIRCLLDGIDPANPGTVTDIDGNVYPTVKIGTQVWMASNLKVEHYNEGTPIPIVTGDAAWAALTTEGMCYYNNDANIPSEIPEITDNIIWTQITSGALSAYNNNWNNVYLPDVTQTPTMSRFYTPTPTTTTTRMPIPTPTPTKTTTRTPTPTKTSTPTLTMIPGVTPSITPTLSPTKTLSITPSLTSGSIPSITPSITPSLTSGIIPSKTPSNTPSLTLSNTPSSTSMVTQSLTPTKTPSKTPGRTPSKTPSLTPSKTPIVVPVASQSLTPTNTPSKTPIVVPAVSQSLTPTNTPSKTPSRTPSKTPSLTPSKTISIIASAFYVATNGSNNNPGSFSLPWLTWNYGMNRLVAGNTLYIRGGTYMAPAASGGDVFAVKVDGRTGTAANHITVSAYPGEIPILDCSNLTSTTGQNIGFGLYNVSYWDIKGLNIINCTQHAVNAYNAQAYYFSSVYHLNITLCTSHHNGDSFALKDGFDDIHYINCDAYENADTYDDPSGALPGSLSNGFYCAPSPGTHIYYDGCRTWNCSDDGWDFYGGSGYIHLTNCWAINNGYCPAGGPISETSGDGSGFKLGPSTTLEVGYQRILKNCLAIGNFGIGIDINMGNYTNVRHTILNCVTALNTDRGFEYWGDNLALIRNCISFGNTSADEFGGGTTMSNNSWQNGLIATSADFVNVIISLLKGARKPDGSLPTVTAFHLVAGSDLINKGYQITAFSNVTALTIDGDGNPYDNPPSLGAFEF